MKIPLHLDLANKTYHSMCKQERVGVGFDKEKAEELVKTAGEWMERLEKEIEPTLPKKEPNIGETKELTPPKIQFKKNGEPSANVIKWFDSIERVNDEWIGTKVVGNQEVKVVLPHHKPILDKIPMKLKDQKDIKEWLMSLGWKPTLWNVKKRPDEYGKKRIVYPIEQTTPKFHENGTLCPNLEAIGERIAIIKPIITYLSLKNRKAVVEGWLSHPRLEVDGRLPAISSGLTNTHRQKHSVVANVPKADPKVILGKEMRSLFVAQNGNVIVGYDASGLEARVEAHFTYPYDNGTYAKELLDGDVHTNNAKIFYPECEIGEDGKARGEWRNPSKNGKYALVYGAQPPRLADTLNIPIERAKEIWEDFWTMNVSLGKLKEDLEKQWFDNGKKFIIGLSGAKIYTRSQHSLINTLFQNAGSVIMDMANALAEKQITKENLRATRGIFMHDEAQWECHPDDAKRVGEIGVWSIKKAGEFFKLNVPLDADYDIGHSWAETH